jgi:hypothetical protein
MSRRPFGFDAVSHERHHWWRRLLFFIGIGVAIGTLLWWWVGGTTGLLLGLLIPLRALAQALAPDIVALGATGWRGLRRLAFKPVQGRFYQFKGHRIRVEDDELLPQRWLALDDLATALGAPIPLPVLKRRAPGATLEQRDGIYVLDETVLAWLREQRDDRAGRLAQWVEREVWYPARGRKKTG